jgi:hypothetical protein
MDRRRRLGIDRYNSDRIWEGLREIELSRTGRHAEGAGSNAVTVCEGCRNSDLIQFRLSLVRVESPARRNAARVLAKPGETDECQFSIRTISANFVRCKNAAVSIPLCFNPFLTLY